MTVRKAARKAKANVSRPRLKPSTPLPIPLPEELRHDVVILPFKIDEGNGLYPGRLVHWAKDLRAEGLDAAYLDDPDHRRWNVLMGDLPSELAIGIGIGIAGNAAWAALVAAFRRVVPAKSQVAARVVRERRSGTGRVDRSWFEYKGDVEGFLEALPQIDVDDKP